MSARPLRDLFGVVCSTANVHRAAERTLARGRRFSREGAAFALRLEERVAALHDELTSGSYRHGLYTLFTVLDPKPRVIAAAGSGAVTSVTAGVLYSLALRTDGTVWAWGNNGAGQLGDGTTTDRLTPVQVSGLSNVRQP